MPDFQWLIVPVETGTEAMVRVFHGIRPSATFLLQFQPLPGTVVAGWIRS